MPRQVGKTSGIVSLMLARGYNREDYRAAYTAQRGTVVTERFAARGDGWIYQLQRTPIGHLYDYSRSAGAERITHRVNGSFLRGFPPVVGRLRGPASDAIVLDEAQEHTDDNAGELLATVVPTMNTRPRRQLILAGTAGGPGWWRDYYDAARAGEHALVEVGTWPDDADPDDEDVWARFHPGVLSGLTDLDALRTARKALGRERFAREYGNRWSDAPTADAIVDVSKWDGLRDVRDPAAQRPIGAGIDVSLDRSRSSLVTVTADGHLRLRADLVPPEQLPDLVTEYAPRVPVLAPPSQTGLVADLRRRGVAADTMDAGQYRTACQRWHDRVSAGTVSHDDQPELRAAIVGAQRAWHGDAWVISARRSGIDVTPVVAAVAALAAGMNARRPGVAGGSD